MTCGWSVQERRIRGGSSGNAGCDAPIRGTSRGYACDRGSPSNVGLCLMGSEKMSVVHPAACGDGRCNRSGQEPLRAAIDIGGQLQHTPTGQVASEAGQVGTMGTAGLVGTNFLEADKSRLGSGTISGVPQRVQARHRNAGAGQGGRGFRWNERGTGHRVLQDCSDCQASECMKQIALITALASECMKDKHHSL
jgi:hypothetical protein